jgi:hypothetical protein
MQFAKKNGPQTIFHCESCRLKKFRLLVNKTKKSVYQFHQYADSQVSTRFFKCSTYFDFAIRLNIELTKC